MSFTYSPNIPQPGDFPSQSQDQILQNYQYLQVFGQKDHQFPGSTSTANVGTHKSVSLTDGASPGITNVSSVLYANTGNGQSQLYFQNNAINAQLTSFKAGVPTAATNGATSLPGGLLLQWGQGTGTYNGSNDITFPVAFSATPYSVTATQIFVAGFRNFIQIDVSNTNATKWTPRLINDGGGNVAGSSTIWWMAIGPA